MIPAGTAGVSSGDGSEPGLDERQARQDHHAAVVDAARAHSEAVARHLDRIAARVRRPLPAGTPRGPRLTELSTLLLADASPGALLRSVLDLALSAVPAADGVSVTLLRPAGRIETAAASHPSVGEADRAQYELHEGPCVEAFERGVSVLAPVLTGGRWPAFAARAHDLGWAGLLGVPLSTRAGRLGSLNLYSARPGALDDASLAAGEALAEQVAVALTNARDFRHQQDVAAALQRSLLPDALPPVPGVRIAAIYRPATSGINVGGDWYDVLPLPGGRLALVVGDVGGHGIGAATTMGHLRTAVRAYALEGHSPARVLELVDTFLQHEDADGYATCLYLALQPGTGAAAWCNAGHPGPVLVLPGSAGEQHGRVVQDLAEAGRVPALGAPVPPGARSAAARGVLPAGSRLLLFTDGLVERRGESLDVGLERLAAAAAERLALPLDRWCDEVVAAQLDGREVDDDIAVLAVEIAAADGSADVAPGPSVEP